MLAPSTEACDRGLKFTAYRRLPSLREYLLIDPDSREVGAAPVAAPPTDQPGASS